MTVAAHVGEERRRVRVRRTVYVYAGGLHETSRRMGAGSLLRRWNRRVVRWLGWLGLPVDPHVAPARHRKGPAEVAPPVR